jgi:hypothetical protein
MTEARPRLDEGPLSDRLCPDALGPVSLGAQHGERVGHRGGDRSVRHGGVLAVSGRLRR